MVNNNFNYFLFINLKNLLSIHYINLLMNLLYNFILFLIHILLFQHSNNNHYYIYYIIILLILDLIYIQDNYLMLFFNIHLI